MRELEERFKVLEGESDKLNKDEGKAATVVSQHTSDYQVYAKDLERLEGKLSRLIKERERQPVGHYANGYEVLIYSGKNQGLDGWKDFEKFDFNSATPDGV